VERAVSPKQYLHQREFRDENFFAGDGKFHGAVVFQGWKPAPPTTKERKFSMEWMMNPEFWMIALAVLFGISESLSMIPQVKSNGVFQAVYNILKFLKEKVSPSLKKAE
jgi:hypothetical protein